jgi:hypothetical protein
VSEIEEEAYSMGYIEGETPLRLRHTTRTPEREAYNRKYLSAGSDLMTKLSLSFCQGFHDGANARVSKDK